MPTMSRACGGALRVCLILIALVALASVPAATNPDHPTVTSGTVRILPSSAGILQIIQGSTKAIINWNGFSINLNELVQFLQPGSNAIVLNRVTGGELSRIQGTLQANGRVFLLNPNGVFIGPTAQINVGSLLASTLSMKDSDFLAGRYVLTQDPARELGAVVNQGVIRVSEGGFVFLAAPLVSNEGLVVASLGRVGLAAGTQTTLNFDDRGLIHFEVSDGQYKPGTVVISTDEVSDVLKSVVSHPGFVEAGTITERDGKTYLGASSGLAVNAGTIHVDGAAGNPGGQVTIESMQASVLPNTSCITASGVGPGSGGGTVRVLSQGNTYFGGSIRVHGGATGNGGCIEVSAQKQLQFRGSICASAPHGKAGTLLLDPTNITITDATGCCTAANPTHELFCCNPGANVTVAAGRLARSNANLVLQACNSITVNSLTCSPIGGTLTLMPCVSLTMQTRTGCISFANQGNRVVTTGTTAPICIQAGNNLTVASLTAAGNITLKAGGGICVGGSLTSTGKCATACLHAGTAICGSIVGRIKCFPTINLLAGTGIKARTCSPKSAALTLSAVTTAGTITLCTGGSSTSLTAAACGTCGAIRETFPGCGTIKLKRVTATRCIRICSTQLGNICLAAACAVDSSKGRVTLSASEGSIINGSGQHLKPEVLAASACFTSTNGMVGLSCNPIDVKITGTGACGLKAKQSFGTGTINVNSPCALLTLSGVTDSGSCPVQTYIRITSTGKAGDIVLGTVGAVCAANGRVLICSGHSILNGSCQHAGAELMATSATLAASACNCGTVGKACNPLEVKVSGRCACGLIASANGANGSVSLTSVGQSIALSSVSAKKAGAVAAAVNISATGKCSDIILPGACSVVTTGIAKLTAGRSILNCCRAPAKPVLVAGGTCLTAGGCTGTVGSLVGPLSVVISGTGANGFKATANGKCGGIFISSPCHSLTLSGVTATGVGTNVAGIRVAASGKCSDILLGAANAVDTTGTPLLAPGRSILNSSGQHAAPELVANTACLFSPTGSLGAVGNPIDLRLVGCGPFGLAAHADGVGQVVVVNSPCAPLTVASVTSRCGLGVAVSTTGAGNDLTLTFHCAALACKGTVTMKAGRSVVNGSSQHCRAEVVAVSACLSATAGSVGKPCNVIDVALSGSGANGLSAAADGATGSISVTSLGKSLTLTSVHADGAAAGAKAVNLKTTGACSDLRLAQGCSVKTTGVATLCAAHSILNTSSQHCRAELVAASACLVDAGPVASIGTACVALDVNVSGTGANGLKAKSSSLINLNSPCAPLTLSRIVNSGCSACLTQIKITSTGAAGDIALGMAGAVCAVNGKAIICSGHGILNGSCQHAAAEVIAKKLTLTAGTATCGTVGKLCNAVDVKVGGTGACGLRLAANGAVGSVSVTSVGQSLTLAGVSANGAAAGATAVNIGATGACSDLILPGANSVVTTGVAKLTAGRSILNTCNSPAATELVASGTCLTAGGCAGIIGNTLTGPLFVDVSGTGANGLKATANGKCGRITIFSLGHSLTLSGVTATGARPCANAVAIQTIGATSDLSLGVPNAVVATGAAGLFAGRSVLNASGQHAAPEVVAARLCMNTCGLVGGASVGAVGNPIDVRVSGTGRSGLSVIANDKCAVVAVNSPCVGLTVSSIFATCGKGITVTTTGATSDLTLNCRCTIEACKGTATLRAGRSLLNGCGKHCFPQVKAVSACLSATAGSVGKPCNPIFVAVSGTGANGLKGCAGSTCGSVNVESKCCLTLSGVRAGKTVNVQMVKCTRSLFLGAPCAAVAGCCVVLKTCNGLVNTSGQRTVAEIHARGACLKVNCVQCVDVCLSGTGTGGLRVAAGGAVGVRGIGSITVSTVSTTGTFFGCGQTAICLSSAGGDVTLSSAHAVTTASTTCTRSGRVAVRAAGSILNGSGQHATPEITAYGVCLQACGATGGVGKACNAIDVGVGCGRLKAVAGGACGSVTVNSPGATLRVKTVTAGGSIKLTTTGATSDLTFTCLKSTGGAITLASCHTIGGTIGGSTGVRATASGPCGKVCFRGGTGTLKLAAICAPFVQIDQCGCISLIAPCAVKSTGRVFLVSCKNGSILNGSGQHARPELVAGSPVVQSVCGAIGTACNPIDIHSVGTCGLSAQTCKAGAGIFVNSPCASLTLHRVSTANGPVSITATGTASDLTLGGTRGLGVCAGTGKVTLKAGHSVVSGCCSRTTSVRGGSVCLSAISGSVGTSCSVIKLCPSSFCAGVKTILTGCAGSACGTFNVASVGSLTLKGVHAGKTVNITTANGICTPDILLGSAGAATVGAAGCVILHAGGSIKNASCQHTAAEISGRGACLVAAGGRIGCAGSNAVDVCLAGVGSQGLRASVPTACQSIGISSLGAITLSGVSAKSAVGKTGVCVTAKSGDLTLGVGNAASSCGTVSLSAQSGSIVNGAGLSEVSQVSGSGAVLQACGTGKSVGSACLPILVHVTGAGGGTLAAHASGTNGTIFVQSPCAGATVSSLVADRCISLSTTGAASDITLTQVSSSTAGTMVLTAGRSILDGSACRNTAVVSAKTAVLTAGTCTGTIGTACAPLQVKVCTGLKAAANGKSGSIHLRSASTLPLSSVSATGAASASQAITATTCAGDIDLTAASAVNTTGIATLSAGRSILNGSGSCCAVGLVAPTVFLTAGSGSIGAGCASPLRLDAGLLFANATAGSINLVDRSGATLASLAARGGVRVTNASGNLKVGSIAAGGPVTLISPGSILTQGACERCCGIVSPCVTLSAGTGIGTPANPLRVKSASLSALTACSGAGLAVADGTEVKSLTLSTVGGPASLQASNAHLAFSGSILCYCGSAPDVAFGNAGGSVSVGTVNAGTNDCLLIKSAGGIADAGGAGTVHLTASNATLSATCSICLDTAVSTLNAASAHGAVTIRNTGTITLPCVIGGTTVDVITTKGSINLGRLQGTSVVNLTSACDILNGNRALGRAACACNVVVLDPTSTLKAGGVIGTRQCPIYMNAPNGKVVLEPGGCRCGTSAVVVGKTGATSTCGVVRGSVIFNGVNIAPTRSSCTCVSSAIAQSNPQFGNKSCSLSLLPTCQSCGGSSSTTSETTTRAKNDEEKAREITGDYSKLTPAGATEALTHLDDAFNAYTRAGDKVSAVRVSDEIPGLLFVARPPGWVAAATSKIDYSLNTSRQLGFTPGIIRALENRGELKALTGDLKGALQDKLQGLSTLESYVDEVGGAALRGTRLDDLALEFYKSVAMAQVKTGRPEDALVTLQKAEETQTVTILGSANVRPHDPAVRRLVLRGGNDQAELAAAQKDLVAEKALPYGKQDPAKIKHLNQIVASTKVEFYKTLAEIRVKDPNYEKLLAVRPVNFAAIQRTVPTDAILVQYLPSADQTYIFELTADQFHIRTVNASSDEIDALIHRAIFQIVRYGRSGVAVRWSWKDDGSAHYKQDVAPLKSSLVALNNILITPLEDDIKDKDIVAFIPTGTLLYLPFPMLAQPTPDGGLEFLIQRKQVASLIKAADVQALATPVAMASRGLVAFGNPDGSLPAAQQEAVDLGHLFKSAEVFVKDKATKAQLMALPPGATYLHLATHGILNNLDPNTSYMILAGAGDAGKLTVPEIFGLPLSGMQLVVLSACQTALAEKKPGSEISSLAEAFSIAGAPSVIASMWSVDDQSTHDLMVAFYQGLVQNMSRAKALQQAQIGMLKNPNYGNPFHWAPFILMGDWR